ncbi:unnamed protein product [Brassicogethes aeneus]|uniref:Regulatory protein zeste n=1 Tax=Brassicogethes aeneus TaxID=1431903 RepID=A0A9P0B2L2_BRAAE|nr:unnamed protein product [Brassicogethes aeneus]
MNESRKKRTPRTSRIQYQLYLDELETNEAFRENKFNNENPQVLKKSWEALCTKLNATGGAIKSIPDWKRTFSDWKAHVRKRARNNRTAQVETGNVGEPEKTLTDIEERLLGVTGKLVVMGLPVPELGLAEPSIPRQAESSEGKRASTTTFEGIVQELTSRQAGGSGGERAPSTTPRLQGGKRLRCRGITQTNVNSESVDVLKSIDNTLKAMLEIKKKKFELMYGENLEK